MSRILSMGLLLAAVSSFSSAAVDPSLLAMAPADSQVVAAVDLSESRSSAFGQFLLHQMNAQGSDFRQFMEQTGFDPRRDLQSILITMQSPRARSHGHFALLARGTFDQSRIKAAAQSKGMVAQQFQGVEILIGSHGHDQAAFAFPSVDLGIMGDLATVRSIIQNRESPSSLDPALQEQISNVQGNSAWFASILAAPAMAGHLDPDVKKPMDQAQVLQSIIRSSGGIQFGSTADLVFNAETRSAQDASALADVVRFFASMVQMQGSNDQRAAVLAPALNSLKVDVTGSAVHITLELPESVLEQLAGPHTKAAQFRR